MAYLVISNRHFRAAVGFPYHESDKKANVLSMPGPSIIAELS